MFNLSLGQNTNFNRLLAANLAVVALLFSDRIMTPQLRLSVQPLDRWLLVRLAEDKSLEDWWFLQSTLIFSSSRMDRVTALTKRREILRRLNPAQRFTTWPRQQTVIATWPGVTTWATEVGLAFDVDGMFLLPSYHWAKWIGSGGGCWYRAVWDES